METRSRRAMTLAVLLMTSTMISLSGASTANAGNATPPPPPASVETSGATVTVMVSGSGYKGGSPGSGSGGVQNESVSVPAPCWMEVYIAGSATGKEYYAHVKSDHYTPDLPFPGYEQYKNDDKGHWYTGTCHGSNWPNQNDLSGFTTFAAQFFATHPPVYIPATQPPPVPPFPPALLREVAVNNLRLPDPQLDWNPKREGSQGTLVNFETWFWLDNSPKTLQVNAAAGDQKATVTVTLAGMDITAPGEEPLSCTGPGTPYTKGAHTTCSLAFSRASIAFGADATPVTVKTRWTGTWALNRVDQGLITPQPTPVEATAHIRVDEIQTVVNRAG